jgi:hypothetical protein
VPDVDGCVGEGLAGAGVEDQEAEREWDAGLVFADGGTEEFVRDVIGADLLLGVEPADGGGR